MTEYVMNISMCKPIKCTICSIELKKQTIFMMHDKPFCSTKCKEKFFNGLKISKIKNHLKRSESHNKLPISLEVNSNMN